MKTSPLLPGSCLWVIAFFAGPAMVGAACAPCVTSVIDLPAGRIQLASFASDEPPDPTPADRPPEAPESLHAFDEGFVVFSN